MLFPAFVENVGVVSVVCLALNKLLRIGGISRVIASELTFSILWVSDWRCHLCRAGWSGWRDCDKRSWFE